VFSTYFWPRFRSKLSVSTLFINPATLLSLALPVLSTGCAVDLARLPTENFEIASSATHSSTDKALDAPRTEIAELGYRMSGGESAGIADLTPDVVAIESGVLVNNPQNRFTNEQDAFAARTLDDDLYRPIVVADGQAKRDGYGALADSELLHKHDSPRKELLDINAVNAPLEALLFSLAEQAGLSLKIKGKVSGQITLRMMQAGLSDVLDQLSDQVSFVWRITTRELQVHIGSAYRQSYAIDYLNLQRQTRSSVGLATRVGTINAANSEGDSVANSSQTRVENISNHDFNV